MNQARPYLRYPHIQGAHVVFVADDDVWIAAVDGGAADGGAAGRLSADHIPVARPKLSPDGAMVAWSSRRDGAPEIHVMPVAGGVARRLTYWGTRTTRLLGWTSQAQVVACSAVGQPFSSYTWAYALTPEGDRTERLPYGPLAALAVHPDGATVVQSLNWREPADWKRYRGGTAAKLWIDPYATGEFHPFLRELDGQVADPTWIGDRLLFVSDHEGHGNVYSVDRDGADLRRHSDHEGMYARNLSGDGTRASYQQGGDLWLVEDLAADAHPRRLDVTLPGSRSARLPVRHFAADALGDLCVDATGRASAVEVRGTAQWLTHLDGPARTLAAAPGVRVRLPRVGGGLNEAPVTVAWITDADGDDALEIRSGSAADAPVRRVLTGRLGRVLELVVAPDGRHLALATHDGRVLVIDLASPVDARGVDASGVDASPVDASLVDTSVQADGSAPVDEPSEPDVDVLRELARNEHGDASGLTFSPDSQWLAWSAPHINPLRRIVLAAVDGAPAFNGAAAFNGAPGFNGAATIDLTEVRFADTDPVFTHDGRFLAFLSARTFDPVYDAHNFELAFPIGIRPYLIPLAADTPSPFGPELDGRRLAGSEAPEGGSEPDAPEFGSDGPRTDGTRTDGTRTEGTARKTTASVPVRVDPEGIINRVVAVPVAAGLYTDLAAAKDGLLWLDHPISGEIGADRPVGAKPPRARLTRWDFTKRQTVELVEGVDHFWTSGDGTRIAVRDGEDLRIGPADHRVDDPAPAEVVTVDLSRVWVVVDPGAEWRQMTTEAWRLMRDHFWVPDMAGVDWDDVLARYLPVVDRLATRDDLSELLWEMIGETGSSHAYERAAAPPTPPGLDAAFLGADLDRDEQGWRISAVLSGESSVPAARSPLSEPGVAIRPGAVLVAVNGTPVTAQGPGPLLAGLAEKPVELTIVQDGARRSVVVVPTADETPLRYQMWVRDRRDHVHARTAGRVGYVHVPDMVSTGWAEFNRDLRTEVAYDALVVDTRENGGGHTSELVIERLARRVLAWQTVRYAGSGTYPTDAPRGPLVSIANEMAGSDGDIVNEAFRSLGLGPIVGVRTWGGVIGIDGRYDLVDGTGVTQPRYAFWFASVGWGVENHGVDPDIEVAKPPQAWVAGADPQLDAGIDVLLAALTTFTPVPQPDLSTRPSRRAPALPPR